MLGILYLKYSNVRGSLLILLRCSQFLGKGKLDRVEGLLGHYRVPLAATVYDPCLITKQQSSVDKTSATLPIDDSSYRQNFDL
jgi:hypothetical protein